MIKEVEEILLKNQQDRLRKDIKDFKSDVIDKIAHTSLENDEFFDSLSVLGNFYKLATESTPELNEQWKQFDQDYVNMKKELDDLEVKTVKGIYKILKDNNIKIRSFILDKRDMTPSVVEVYVRDDFGKDCCIFHESYYEAGIGVLSDGECLDKVIEWFDSQKSNKSCKKLDSLIDKLERLEQNKTGLNAPQRALLEHRINKLSNYNEDNSRFATTKYHIDIIKKAYQEIDSLERALDDVKEKIKTKEPEIEDRKESLKKTLHERAKTVLTLRYLSVYNNNFECLSMMPEGAKPTLQKLLTKGAEYYAKANIDTIAKNFDDWLKIGEIAGAIHNGWRELRKDKEGNFEPRWKEVKDEMFIKKVQSMEKLPKNIRIVDGVVEQDIANTEFNDLCLDYQLENFDAAHVAYQVSQDKYTRDQAGVVGEKIHNAWLKRNPWAKGGELDVTFKDLIRSEKIKDLMHYEEARKIREKQDSRELL